MGDIKVGDLVRSASCGCEGLADSYNEKSSSWRVIMTKPCDERFACEGGPRSIFRQASDLSKVDP